MEKKPKNGIRNILLGVIGVLLLVLGIVIGLIIAGILSDRPLIGGAQESQEHVQITGETLEESFESETDKMTDRQDDTGETVAQETRESVPETEPIRIVLDPGHDDYCSRNHPDLGVNEQDLNLKILTLIKRL